MLSTQQINAMDTPIFLRDLEPNLRIGIEKSIEKDGDSELKKAIEDGRDITVGTFLNFHNYHVTL